MFRSRSFHLEAALCDDDTMIVSAVRHPGHYWRQLPGWPGQADELI